MSEIITTFDGVEHEKDALLKLMDNDDFYYDYLGKNALSSSSLKWILKSPNVYVDMVNGEQPDSQPLRDGKLIHWRVLEPEKFAAVNTIQVSSRTTNAYKAAVEEKGEVFLEKEIDNANRVADALLKNDVARGMLEGAEYEVPAIKMIDGIPFRGKADALKGREIIDVKTTADINGFRWSAQKFGYDLQAYLYLQLFPEAHSFTFLVIDKKTSDIGVFECSPQFLDDGRRKLEKGIADYKYFFQDNNPIEQFVIRELL